MKREEAIRVLEDNRPSVIFEDEDAQKRMAELCHAIDMAIEALQAEPNCHKCAIKELWEETEKEDLVSVVRRKDCRHAYFKDFDGYCPQMVNALKPDGFCYRGERREP